MRYVFGPVNSRRFGISLGIDLSPDEKSCNFDCVYCELKGAKPVSVIKNPPNVNEIIAEIKKSLSLHNNIDVITITSNGEPTLYENLDKLVDELNKIKKDKKLLILSNSSRICNMSVQNTLQKIDMVKLSLDCATQKCFKKIDRALKGIMIQDLTNCIKNFSKKFNNNLIIEILVVKGINDKTDEFKKLNEVLNDIKPARVDIGTIDRPPAYQVEAVDQKDMLKLSKIITDIPVSLIYKNNPDKKEDFSKEEILKLIAHRPQSQYDIDNFFSDNAKKIVENLLKNNIIVKKDIAGVVFYRLNER